MLINYSSLPLDLRCVLKTDCDQLGFSRFGDCITAILTHSDFIDRWDLSSLTSKQQTDLTAWREGMVTDYNIQQLA